jgi:hypothetical protein
MNTSVVIVEKFSKCRIFGLSKLQTGDSIRIAWIEPDQYSSDNTNCQGPRFHTLLSNEWGTLSILAAKEIRNDMWAPGGFQFAVLITIH